MRILIINQSDLAGGAAIAAYRLATALRERNHQVRFIVGSKRSNDPDVLLAPALPRIDRALGFITKRIGLNYINKLGSLSVLSSPELAAADVVNLHNLHTDYFNYLAVRSIARLRPVVFTLHDMWSLTGHCAHSLDCERWRSGCGRCPYPQAYPAILRDATRTEWRLKNWAFSGPMTLVSPSLWLQNIARQRHLSGKRVVHIPNGLDLEVFRPQDRARTRASLGISDSNIVILFSAYDLNDASKGAKWLLNVCSDLPQRLRERAVFLLMGQRTGPVENPPGLEIRELGLVESDNQKAKVYSASDLFIFPTIADNLPLVLQESMACGLPAIAANVGGVPELVQDGVNGLTFEAGSARALLAAISLTLSSENVIERFRQKCIEFAREKYDVRLQAARYEEIFIDEMKRRSSGTPVDRANDQWAQ